MHGRQCTHRPIYICILPKFTCCSAVVTLPLQPPGWYRAHCASLLLSCRTIHFLPSCMHASSLSFILSLSLLFLHPASLSLSIGLPSSGISLASHPRSPSFSLRSNVRKWILYLARNSFRKVLLTRDWPCKHTRVQLCASMWQRICSQIHAHTAAPDRYYDDRYARVIFLRALAPPPQPIPRAGCWISSGPFATGWQPARIHGATANQDTRVRRVASPWAAPFQNEFFFSLFVSFSVPLCTCNLCICAWMDVWVCVFTVTARLTRSNEGTIARFEPEDRAVCPKESVFMKEHFPPAISLRQFSRALFPPFIVSTFNILCFSRSFFFLLVSTLWFSWTIACGTCSRWCSIYATGFFF